MTDTMNPIPQSELDSAFGTDTGWRGPSYRLPSNQVDPSLFSVMDSALRLENSFESAANYLGSGAPLFGGSNDFDAWPIIKDTKYQQYFPNFLKARSKEDVYSLMSLIDQEQRDRETIANAGGWGVASSFIAGGVDPFNLLPVGGAMKWAGQIPKLMKRTATGFGVATGIGFGSTAAQEGLLYGTQQLRTPEEVGMGIGVGTFISGLLGGAASMLPPSKLDDITTKVKDELEGTDTLTLNPLPVSGYGRNSFREDLITQWGIDEVQVDAALSLFDNSVAKVWARENGRTVEDFYSENLAGVMGLDAQKVMSGDLSNVDEFTANLIAANNGKPFKGAVNFLEDGKAVIAGFKGVSDISTVLHELSHVHRKTLSGDDLSILEQWLGIEDGIWKVGHEEAYVKAVETVFKDGKFDSLIPEPVQKVLAKFRDFLVDIYSRIKDTKLGNEITPEVKAVIEKHWIPNEEGAELFKNGGTTIKALRGKVADLNGNEALYIRSIETQKGQPSGAVEALDRMKRAADENQTPLIVEMKDFKDNPKVLEFFKKNGFKPFKEGEEAKLLYSPGYTKDQLAKLKKEDLRKVAKGYGVEPGKLNKEELQARILKAQRGTDTLFQQIPDGIYISESGIVTIEDFDLISKTQYAAIAKAMKSFGYDWNNAAEAKAYLKEASLRGPLNSIYSRAVRQTLVRGDKGFEVMRAKQRSKKIVFDAKTIIKNAKTIFGVTEDFREAGYILTDGKLLDFSGKNEGGTPGLRSKDHREISQVEGLGSGTVAMQRFLGQGNIRIDAGNPHYSAGMIHAFSAPTAKQKPILKKLIEFMNGEIDMSLENGLGEFDEQLEYYKTNNSFEKVYEPWTPTNKILKDIDDYYSGAVRQTDSDVQRFAERWDDDSVLFQTDLTEEDKPFFSSAKKIISNKMQKADTGEGILKLLKSGDTKNKVNPVTKDELTWTGLDEFLKSKPKFTKQEVLDYIQAHKVHVIERVYTDGVLEAGDADLTFEINDYAESDDGVTFHTAYDARSEQSYEIVEQRTHSVGYDNADGYEVEIDRFDTEAEAEEFKESFFSVQENTEELTPQDLEVGQSQLFEDEPKQVKTEYEIVDADGNSHGIYDNRDDADNRLDELQDKLSTYTTSKYTVNNLEYGYTIAEDLEDFRDAENAAIKDLKDYYRDHEVLGEGIDGEAKHSSDDRRLPGPSSDYRELVLIWPDNPNRDFTVTSHWDDENVLGHIRGDTRRDIDGNTVFLVDEIQSDWMQEMRDLGAIDDETQKAKRTENLNQINQLNKEIDELKIKLSNQPKYADLISDINYYNEQMKPMNREKTRLVNEIYNETEPAIQANKRNQLATLDAKLMPLRDKVRDLQNELDTLTNEFNEKFDVQSRIQKVSDLNDENEKLWSAVPPAPFSKTYNELLVKRVIGYAIENNFDRVTWTGADLQAERWSNTEHVDRIEFNPQTKTVKAVADNGAEKSMGDMDESNLHTVIGTTLSRRIITSRPNEDGIHIIRGDDLIIPKEGFIKNYGEVGSHFKKFAKKFNAEFGTTAIPNHGVRWSRKVDLNQAIDENIVAQQNNRNIRTASLPYHILEYIDITDEMKKSYRDVGLPLFQQLEEGDYKIEKIPYLPEAVVRGLGKMTPGIRPFLSNYSSLPAQIAEGLIETGIKLGKHARGGRSEMSVETNTKVKVNLYSNRTIESINNSFVKYRYRLANKPNAPEEARIRDIVGYKIKDQFSLAEGTLNYNDFKRAVHDEWSGKDTGIQEAKESANVIKGIMKEIEAELKSAGLLPKDHNDPNYKPRIWSQFTVNDFKSDLSNIIYGDATKKMKVLIQSTLSKVDKELTKETLEKTAKDIAFTHHVPHSKGVARLLNKILDKKNKNQLIDLQKGRMELEAYLEKHDTKRINKEINTGINNIDKSGLGHLWYDIQNGITPSISQVGFLKKRALDVDDAALIDVKIDGVKNPVSFIETDPEKIVKSYLRSVIPDLELKSKYGSIDMVKQLTDLVTQYDVMINLEPNLAKRQAMQKEKVNNVRDLEAMRDRIRGRYNLPKDPRGAFTRITNSMMKLNQMFYLGSAVISQIPDFARLMFRHNLSNYGSTLQKYATIPEYRKEYGRYLRSIGAALELTTSQRLLEISDLTDSFGGKNIVERGIDFASEHFGLVTALNAMNNFNKSLAGIVISDEILDTATKVKAAFDSGEVRYKSDGTLDGNLPLTEKQIDDYAQLGLNIDDLKKIGDQYKRFGDHNNPDIHLPRSFDWDDLEIKQRFERVVVREIDNTIITPGVGDRPLIASTELGKLAFQFRSFTTAQINRGLIPMLQQRDGRVVAAILASLFLGGVTYSLKQLRRGQEVSDDAGTWLAESLDNSGILGWLMDFNGVIERISDNRVGINPTIFGGEGMARFQNRGAGEVILGPSSSTINRAMQFGEGLMGIPFGSGLDEQTINAGVRLMPYSRLWWFGGITERMNKAFQENLTFRGYLELAEDE